jgi:LacI family transcriptional regulator
MSFVGCDNIEAGKYLTPSLTTLDLKEDEHAVRIFEMLEAQIKSINIEDRNVRIAPELVVRESCGTPSK